MSKIPDFLDADNIALPKSGAINAVLYHELRQDMRCACQDILRAQGALQAVAISNSLSSTQIITVFNMPVL